jgi:glycosyltransferase involved in cell wall biosynthesis
MTSSPFFSIITISFNQSPYISEAIESVLAQGFKSYEYIVQDPGSSDGSREIISAYSSSLIMSFEEDLGPADGLNKAFSKAHGKYFLFLNSDDRLLPGALQILHDWIIRDNFAHDVYSGGCRIIDNRGQVLRRAYSDSMNLRRASYGQCILIQPSTAFSAESFVAVNGFNRHNTSNWDGELFVDIALASFSFARTMRVLSDYRIHQRSITGSGSHQAAHKQHANRMYKKITQKHFSEYSSALRRLYSLERKLLNPLDTFERAVHGPIYKSA